MKDKAEVILELKAMLCDVFMAKAAAPPATPHADDTYGRLARAHGYIDGYMRALLELGFISKRELVELVNSERERSSPAMRPLAELGRVAHA